MPFDPMDNEKRKDNPRALFILWVLAFIVIAPGAVLQCINGWRKAPSYIPHTETVDIYFKGDWIQGEYKVCAGIPNDPPKSHDLEGLDCPARTVIDGSRHNVSVRFYGRTIRPDVVMDDEWFNRHFQWRCRREADSFTCYALN